MLIALVSGGGCFAPGETDSLDEVAETDGDDGALDDAATDGDDDAADDDAADDDAEGDEAGTDDGQNEDDTGTTTAEQETGDESTTDDGADESTGSTETGEACEEVGTPEHCLECGDACAEAEVCMPEGCLGEIALGHAEEFPGIGGIEGFLWGFPVAVENDSYLTHFGFIANGQGGDLQLALYSDVAGEPANRISMIDPVSQYATGTHEIAVDPPVPLAEGTYWIMASGSEPIRLGILISGTLPNFPVAGVTHQFGDALPDTIDTPNSFFSHAPNLYINVLQ